MAKQNKNTQKNTRNRRPRISEKAPTWVRNTIIAVGLLLLIAIAGVYSYYSGFFAFLQVTSSSYAIRQELTESRQEVEQGFDTEQNNRIKLLYLAGLINSETPTHSAKVDTCYFTSQSKNKFTVVNWTQNCFIRYVDILETSLTRDEIFQKLAESNSLVQVFGTPHSYNSGRDDKCANFYDDFANPRNLSLGFLDWSRGNNLSCKLYDPSTNRSGLSRNTATHLIRSYNPNDVAHDKSYLSIGEDYGYFSKSLGCGARDLFGCEPPIKDPITDFDKP